jgi:hypothetical protein
VQIDFLEEGSEDCPLIRLYGVEASQFAILHEAILSLATGAQEECPLHEVPGFRALSGCKLKLLLSSADAGIRRIGRNLDFEWRLTPTRWFVVAGLVEPFAQRVDQGSSQWLSGKEARHGLDLGDISVLLSCSVDGRW